MWEDDNYAAEERHKQAQKAEADAEAERQLNEYVSQDADYKYHRRLVGLEPSIAPKPSPVSLAPTTAVSSPPSAALAAQPQEEELGEYSPPLRSHYPSYPDEASDVFCLLWMVSFVTAVHSFLLTASIYDKLPDIISNVVGGLCSIPLILIAYPILLVTELEGREAFAASILVWRLLAAALTIYWVERHC